MTPRTALRLLTALLLAVAGGTVASPPPAGAAATTVVSLTFDDGQVSQLAAVPILQAHGMTGTFYVNSGLMGWDSRYYMTWSQLKGVADAGNEIGGHTVRHDDLTGLSPEQAAGAVCDDRAALREHGYEPRSFAYPFAVLDDATERLVEQCGYLSGRNVGGVTAESLPPQDPFRIRTPAPANDGTRLAGLEAEVRAAEDGGGGWVVIVFHGICDDSCTGPSSTTVADFAAFLDFLQARAGSGTVVREVGDVVGGVAPPPNGAPTTVATCDGAPCTSAWRRRAVALSLAATDPEGQATSTYLTLDGSDPRTSGTRVLYTEPLIVSATTRVRYYSRDASGSGEKNRSLLVRVDGARPRVVVKAPTDGAVVRKSGPAVTWSAVARDLGTGSEPASGIDRVVFRDGTRKVRTLTTPVPGTSRYRFSWKPTGVLGRHDLTAVAWDEAGNKQTSVVVRVRVRR